MADLDAIADRLDIIDLCQRPHWNHDHDLWDEFDDLYTETVSMPTAAQAAAADFDVTTYLDAYLVSRAQLKRGMQSFKAGLLTQHLVTGHRVVVDGDTAVCTAHAINVHFPADDVRDETMLMHGNEYRWDLLRTAKGWRIRGFIGIVRWGWGHEGSHDADGKQKAWLEAAGD